MFWGVDGWCGLVCVVVFALCWYGLVCVVDTFGWYCWYDLVCAVVFVVCCYGLACVVDCLLVGGGVWLSMRRCVCPLLLRFSMSR